MKKVLIITYYWPPAGGPGVQRVLKFTKYLPEFEWEPIILTVKDGEYIAHDYSLIKDIPENITVYQRKIWEPTRIYKKIIGIPENTPLPAGVVNEEKDSLKKKISSWIRLNCFIPDAKVSLPFQMYHLGKKIIEEQKPDVIFSTAPPHSIHLLAYRLKKWSNLPWVADFRDPWTNIYSYKDQKRFILSEKFDRLLERKVLLGADARISVGENYARELRAEEYGLKFNIIYNGYDEDDFDQDVEMDQNLFFITYTGNLNQYRNPITLWRDLLTLKEKNDDILQYLRVRLIGVVHPKVIESIRSFGIESYISIEGYVPHHEAVKALKESALLLMPISRSKSNVSIVNGKLFEYLASQRYILYIGPKNSEGAEIIKSTHSGELVDYNESTIPVLKKVFDMWKENKYNLNNYTEIKKYSRKEETKQLSEILNSISGKNI